MIWSGGCAIRKRTVLFRSERVNVEKTELYALSSLIKFLKYTEAEILAEANRTYIVGLPHLPFLPPLRVINLLWLVGEHSLTVDGGSQRR